MAGRSGAAVENLETQNAELREKFEAKAAALSDRIDTVGTESSTMITTLVQIEAAIANLETRGAMLQSEFSIAMEAQSKAMSLRIDALDHECDRLSRGVRLHNAVASLQGVVTSDLGDGASRGRSVDAASGVMELVEDLREQVMAMCARIDSLQGECGTIGPAVARLQADVAGLVEQHADMRSGRMDSLRAEVQALGVRMDSLQGECSAMGLAVARLEGDVGSLKGQGSGAEILVTKHLGDDADEKGFAVLELARLADMLKAFRELGEPDGPSSPDEQEFQGILCQVERALSGRQSKAVEEIRLGLELEQKQRQSLEDALASKLVEMSRDFETTISGLMARNAELHAELTDARGDGMGLWCVPHTSQHLAAMEEISQAFEARKRLGSVSPR